MKRNTKSATLLAMFGVHIPYSDIGEEEIYSKALKLLGVE